MNHADRNMLFGILAVQMDFVARDALIAAMHAWVLEKSRPLGRILVDQQALSSGRHDLLEQLVDEHLAAHGGDAEKSLAATDGLGAFRDELKQLADPVVDATLDRVLSAGVATEDDPAATLAHSEGSPAAGSRFSILRPHARGGLGQVSVALDSELNREVALKELRPERADEQASRTRFLLEAEITGRLEHPGIVPVYGLGCDARGRPFYAMRFVKGENLKEAIDHFHQAEETAVSNPRRWNLALRQLLNRFVAVCNVIAYAHSRGVIHRDLKPANILLGPYGETLVVDWGLAKVVGRGEAAVHLDGDAAEVTLQPASGSSETLPGTAIGTPAYMSPEQAEGRLERVGPPSDVYSLGATLYGLLTGRPAIDETDVGEALRRVQRGEFPPPRAVRPSISHGLEAICLKAMALKPEDRYGSAGALAEDLEHWLADEAVSAYRDPISTRLTRWGRRHKSVAAGIGALLVTGIAALLVSNILIGYQKQQTELQRRDAETQRGLANDRAKDLERELYIDRVNRAYREWEVNNLRLVERLLDECPPALRGLEWRFVRRLCHLDERTDRNAATVYALAFSPDGRTIASGGGTAEGAGPTASNGELVLRDAETGAERFPPRRNMPTDILGLAFSPLGDLLASVGVQQRPKRQGVVTLWDPKTGGELDHQLVDDTEVKRAWCVAFSFDGRRVAVGYVSDTWETGGYVKVWEVSGGKLKPNPVHLPQPDVVLSVAFSPDGRLAVTSGGQAQVFHAEGSGWSKGPIFPLATGYFAVACHPKSKLIAVGGWDRVIHLWDPDTGAERPLPGHEGFIRALAYNRDGSRLASAAEDGTVRVWDPETGHLQATFRGHQSHVRGVAFHPEGRLIASGGFDRMVKTWDLVQGQPLAFRGHGAWVNSLDFSPDGARIVSGSGFVGEDRSVRVWDATTGQQLQKYEKHRAYVVLARFLPGGRHVISFDIDATVRVWDATDGSDVDVPLVVGPAPYAFDGLAVRPDGREFAVGYPDGTIRLWDRTTRKARTLSGHTGKVIGLAYSPRGDRLASTSALGGPTHGDARPGGELKLWDIATGRELTTPRRGIGVFRSLAFSPDGRRLVLSHGDGGDEEAEAHVWNAETGAEVSVLRGHTGHVQQVAFSPDGSLIATAAGDKTVKLWDAATGQEVFTFRGHTAGVRCLAFSPEGDRLASGGIDWTARVWDARPLKSD